MPGGVFDKELSHEEHASLERAFQDNQRQQEEERKRHEIGRKAAEEREKQRKAKLGSAFLVDDDQEDDIPQRPASGALLVRKSVASDMPYSEMPPYIAATAPRQLATSSGGAGQDPRFVEAMGGDQILQEAHALLHAAAGTGRLGAPALIVRSQSPRRGRRRRSRSPIYREPNVRSSGSYRSPTPDGRARGQARAARKAKMIACLMGMDPRTRP